MKIKEFLTEAPKIKVLSKAEPAKKSAPTKTAKTKNTTRLKADPEIVAKYIQTHAQPWLNQTGNGKLMVFRGTNSNEWSFVKDIRQDRRPVDTPQDRHLAYNNIIAVAGGVANRSNSAFVSGDYNMAAGYGNVYVFIPLGDFRYTWSPKFSDWTEELEIWDLKQLMKPFDFKSDAKAQAHMKNVFAKAIKEFQREIKTAKTPKIRAFYEKRLADIQNPQSKYYKEFQKEQEQYYVNINHWSKTVSWEYDPKKVKQQVIADQNLVRAIKSGNEIMIHAAQGIYVQEDFYIDSVLPLLKQKGKKQESQDHTDSVNITEGVNDPDIFKAVFLVGGPGSGKTSVSEKLLSHTGLRRVDVDPIASLLKKKSEIAGTGYEKEFYSQAGELADRQRKLLSRGRLGILFDSTGRNINVILSVKKELESLGYDTMMIYVKADIHTAQSRNELRRRRVNPQDVERMHSEVDPNIKTFKETFGDNFIEIDNTWVPNLGPATAKVNAFLNQAPSKPQARRWINKNSP